MRRAAEAEEPGRRVPEGAGKGGRGVRPGAPETGLERLSRGALPARAPRWRAAMRGVCCSRGARKRS